MVKMGSENTTHSTLRAIRSNIAVRNRMMGLLMSSNRRMKRSFPYRVYCLRAENVTVLFSANSFTGLPDTP